MTTTHRRQGFHQQHSRSSGALERMTPAAAPRSTTPSSARSIILKRPQGKKFCSWSPTARITSAATRLKKAVREIQSHVVIYSIVFFSDEDKRIARKACAPERYFGRLRWRGLSSGKVTDVHNICDQRSDIRTSTRRLLSHHTKRDGTSAPFRRHHPPRAKANSPARTATATSPRARRAFQRATPNLRCLPQ